MASKPSIIISDIGRREDSVGDDGGYNATAGLLLIEEIRNSGRTTPIIIATTPDNVVRYKEDTMKLGGNGIVCSMADLVLAIKSALPVASAQIG